MILLTKENLVKIRKSSRAIRQKMAQSFFFQVFRYGMFWCLEYFLFSSSVEKSKALKAFKSLKLNWRMKWNEGKFVVVSHEFWLLLSSLMFSYFGEYLSITSNSIDYSSRNCRSTFKHFQCWDQLHHQIYYRSKMITRTWRTTTVQTKLPIRTETSELVSILRAFKFSKTQCKLTTSYRNLRCLNSIRNFIN